MMVMKKHLNVRATQEFMKLFKSSPYVSCNLNINLCCLCRRKGKVAYFVEPNQKKKTPRDGRGREEFKAYRSRKRKRSANSWSYLYEEWNTDVRSDQDWESRKQRKACYSVQRRNHRRARRSHQALIIIKAKYFITNALNVSLYLS